MRTEHKRLQECCHVCGRPLDEVYAVLCSVCHRDIHFEPAGPEGENCASVVTRLNVCGLSFICSACLGQQSTASDNPVG